MSSDTVACEIELEIVGLSASMTSNVGFLLARLGIAAADGFVRDLEPLGIGPRHFAVLSLIDESDEELSQRAAGSCLAIDKSSMVAVTDDLESAGLLRRRRSAEDRRRNVLELTADGRRLLIRARRAAAASEQALLAPLDGDQEAALRGALRHLINAMAVPQTHRRPGAMPGLRVMREAVGPGAVTR